MNARAKQIAELVGAVTYKPGWTFSVYEEPWETSASKPVAVAVTFDVQCVNDDSRRVQMFRSIVPFGLLDFADAPARFYGWLLDFVIGPAERHEMQEWLHVDGVRIFDPHKAAA